MQSLRVLVSEAMRAAGPSLDALAGRLGLSSSALRYYRLGRRLPSPETVDRIARELRRQAAQMQRLAEQLEHGNRKRRDDA